MTDREVDDALARSFLADLPPELVGRLRAEGERADYPAGTTVYRAGSGSQAGLGVAVRVGGPASPSVQAVEASSLFRISARMLTAAARTDPRACWAIAEELNRRLYDTL